MSHFKAFSAIFPIIIKKQRDQSYLLLARRQNTGFMDGYWDFAGSGHIDENETAKEAIIREAKEELEIEIELSDIDFAHLSHRVGKNGDRTYFDLYFNIKAYTGEPKIAEPHKCSDLKWFNINDLPNDMIEIRRECFRQIQADIGYSEIECKTGKMGEKI